MATVKTAVKQSLLGSEQEPDLSLQTRATFEKYSTQDEATGEAFMKEDDFVNAIAPESENYVSFVCCQKAYLQDFPHAHKLSETKLT